MDEEKRYHTSDLLEGVMQKHEADVITVGEIKNSLHERGFGVLMAIAALPLCLPIPVPPGYTTLFSIPLFILSVQMILGMDSPWIPTWLARMEIKRERLAGIMLKAIPLLRKLEKLSKPRLSFASTETGEKVIGFMAFIFTLSIAIPLPLTNLPPGFGILIMSLGMLSKDGIAIIIGMIIGIIGVGITTIIVLLGKKALISLFPSSTTVIIPHP